MIERFAEVTWLDAARHVEESYYEMLGKPTKEYLVERTGYGKLLKDDKHGVILLTDRDEDDKCEFDVIPKGMIISMSIQTKDEANGTR